MVRLDRAVIAQLREAVGDKVFTEIADDFIKDCKRLEKGLLRSLRSGDVRGARTCAHELRALAALFGADELAQSCSVVDSAGGGALIEAARTAKLCSDTHDALKRLLHHERAGAA